MWSLGPTSRLQPDHLRYLSRGINTHNALDVPVPERLYCPLIVSFSEGLASNKENIPQVYPYNDDGGDRDVDSDREETFIPPTPLDLKVNNIIRDCYNFAHRLTPESPSINVAETDLIKLQVDNAADAFRQFMKSFSITIQSVIDGTDEMMAAEIQQFQPGLPTETPFDIQAALREASRSIDYDHSLDLMRQVSGVCCRNSHTIVETAKKQLHHLLDHIDSMARYVETGRLDTDDDTME